MDKILLALIAALAAPLYALSNPAHPEIPASAPVSESTPLPVGSEWSPESRVSASDNWAGYIAGDGEYTEVGGSWTIREPQSISSQPLSTDAAWVGIGGVSHRDLIQAGTETIVEDGVASYEAWYETLPDEQHMIPLEINPGDTVSVSLAETSPGIWHLTCANETSGKRYENDIAYDSSKTSAEWIEERPLVLAERSTGYAPLNHFGTISFQNSYAVKDGTRQSITDLAPDPVHMVSDGLVPLAAPSDIAANGSFVVAESDEALAESQPASDAGDIAASRPHRHRSRDYDPDPVVVYLLGF